MASIKVIIENVDFDASGDAFPVTTFTIDSEDVDTVTKLEGLFRAVAHAAGFTYVGAVECRSFKSLEVQE